jgi:hypothetical protein
VLPQLLAAGALRHGRATTGMFWDAAEERKQLASSSPASHSSAGHGWLDAGVGRRACLHACAAVVARPSRWAPAEAFHGIAHACTQGSRLKRACKAGSQATANVQTALLVRSCI